MEMTGETVHMQGRCGYDLEDGDRSHRVIEVTKAALKVLDT